PGTGKKQESKNPEQDLSRTDNKPRGYMRIRLIGLVGAAALASAMANSGCSGSSTTGGGTGGTTGSGGTGGTSAPQNCPGGPTCGGSVVGTWSVPSSCLALAGDMDVSLSSLGCAKVP